MENKREYVVVRHERMPNLKEIVKIEMRKQYRNERVITSYNMICTFVNAKFMVKHATTKKVVSFDTLEGAINFMVTMGRI